jgi:hypothetical protein
MVGIDVIGQTGFALEYGLAHWTLVCDPSVDVSLFRMPFYAVLALHELAAELADESSSSRHHMFVKECLH